MKKIISFVMFMRKSGIFILILLCTLCLVACNAGKNDSDMDTSIIQKIEGDTSGESEKNSDTSNEVENKNGLISSNKYEVTVSYAGWGDQSDYSELVREKALNNKKSDIYGNLFYPIYKMDTKKDLEGFKSDFEEIFVMNQPMDELPSFEEATSKYDEKFFEKNALFIVYLGGTSSSCRYGVHSVCYRDEHVFEIDIRQINDPEICNSDMVGYFFIIAIADSEFEGCKYFDAY